MSFQRRQRFESDAVVPDGVSLTSTTLLELFFQVNQRQNRSLEALMTGFPNLILARVEYVRPTSVEGTSTPLAISVTMRGVGEVC